MDGFFRRPEAKSSTPVKARAASQPTQRKTERSHTLMRHVVPKPKANAPSAAKTEAKKPTAIKPTNHAQARQQRAAGVPKSSLISRFSSNSRPAIDKKVAHLPVKPHPISHPADEPPISQAIPSQKTSNSFEDAMQAANSHKQPPLKAKKIHHRVAKKLGVASRTVSIASVSLVIVLLSGFVAYQNVPNISMRLAGARAGFTANLPGYTPGGFGLAGPIKTSPGVVTVSFRSHSDDRSYQVTQKPSNWTSDSLRSNFFAVTDTPTAYQDKGKTIYLYNNGSNATWVNGGIVYQISGNANLSSDQVVNIADSL